MEIVEWASPAPKQSSSSTNSTIAAALKGQKGEWACLEEKVIEGDPKGEAAQDLRSKASNRASLIKNGRLAPFRPAGTFDAASRSEVTDDGRHVVRVYAQYKGEEFAKPPKVKKDKAAEVASPSEPVEAPDGAPATV